MRYNCGPSFEARFAAKQEWHRWFAWRPVRVGENDCRWLETVERKGRYVPMQIVSSSWDWEYRACA